MSVVKIEMNASFLGRQREYTFDNKASCPGGKPHTLSVHMLICRFSKLCRNVPLSWFMFFFLMKYKTVLKTMLFLRNSSELSERLSPKI